MEIKNTSELFAVLFCFTIYPNPVLLICGKPGDGSKQRSFKWHFFTSYPYLYLYNFKGPGIVDVMFS